MIKLKVEKKEDGNVLRMFEDNQTLTENELKIYGSVEELMQSAEYAVAKEHIIEKFEADDVKSLTLAERVLFAFQVLFDNE